MSELPMVERKQGLPCWRRDCKAESTVYVFDLVAMCARHANRLAAELMAGIGAAVEELERESEREARLTMVQQRAGALENAADVLEQRLESQARELEGYRTDLLTLRRRVGELEASQKDAARQLVRVTEAEVEAERQAVRLTTAEERLRALEEELSEHTQATPHPRA